jgi:O-antigen biosynthesis protein
MRYQAVIDTTNKNNSHTLTIDLIQEAARGEWWDILDVGCSAGYLGEYLVAQGHRVTGIDITQEAVDSAKKFLTDAYCMKVEEYFDRYPNNKFDVIIFGDVLEHVTNAEEVLRMSATALKPNGKVIASIPNVGHLAIRAMLLEGRWEYGELGLLDRDHVRFFTEKSIRQLFADSNYGVDDMRSVRLPVETVDNICDLKLNPAFVKLAQNAAKNDLSADVFQYVVMAKPMSQNPRVVCMVPHTNNGLFEFRVLMPLNNWALRFGGNVRYRVLGEHHTDDLIWGDIFLFQRIGGAYTLHLIKTLKAHNKRVVFEIDDLLTELPEFLAHHRGSPEIQKSLLDAISLADAVTTTTNRLASRLKHINPAVHCVPNCVKALPAERLAHDESVTPKATLIVASSDTVMVDFLITPLKIILEKYGTDIRLVVVGPVDKALAKGGLKFERFPVLSYMAFKGLLQTLINPIGLIPLDDSVFSSCKSPIKFFDYAAAQIPAICSDMPPYSDYIKDGHTGLLVKNTNQAWTHAIEALINSAEDRNRLSLGARAYTLETHLENRAGDAWQKLLETLDIDRSGVPVFIKASNLHVRPNVNVRWVISKLLQRRTYGRLREILKEEGFNGIKKKVSWW